jgi:hypothetical protein
VAVVEGTGGGRDRSEYRPEAEEPTELDEFDLPRVEGNGGALREVGVGTEGFRFAEVVVEEIEREGK